MFGHSRRKFLQNVGSGMMAIGLGPDLASDLGFSMELDQDESQFDFGELTGLIRQMQETPAERLQPRLVQQLNAGSTTLKQFIAAAALANAETFGGEDYVGYHAEMALIPALQISTEMPDGQQALPVLKVIYRNTDRIQAAGGSKKKTLLPISKTKGSDVSQLAPQLKAAVRAADMDKAEQVFAKFPTAAGVDRANVFDMLLHTIQDEVDVHRFVLAYRAYGLIDIVGAEHADAMLRQCVRHCVSAEQNRISQKRQASPIRSQLPKLMDQYKLASLKPGTKDPGAEWVRTTSAALYEADKFVASDIVAGALADQVSPEVVGAAISLAANHLVLRQGTDPWRTHGASAGVHCSDSVNAWRNMARVSNDRNVFANLIVAGFYAGRYDAFKTEAYPLEAHLEKVKTRDAVELLDLAEEAIRGNDQPLAAAALDVYGNQNFDRSAAFTLLRKYAISEDGRLHSEKYYQTVVEESARATGDSGWDYLTALARVTASSYGFDVADNRGHRAPGYQQARELLKLDS